MENNKKPLTGQAVIIAAGESSRFWPLNANNKHKSQIYLLGKPLIYWTIKGCVGNGVKDIIVVQNPRSSIREMLEKENDLGARLSFAVQKKPLGTGNALWQARKSISAPFFVLWPNKVNAGALVGKMKAKQKEEKADAILVGAETATTWDYGIMKFEKKRVVEIVENPEKGKEPSRIKTIGAYLLQPDFFDYYEKLSKHHEADFIEALDRYLKNKEASTVILEREIPALKYPWELFGIFDILLASESFRSFIAKTANIGKNVVMEGFVYVGENTKIQAGTIIEGPAYIGDNCIIGNHNVLRGPLNIESGVMTGAFMEIKHSIVQKNTHFHSGYLGDSMVGENCRFGAGFISANRRLDREHVKSLVKGEKIDTGLDAFGCVVGDDTKFGIHCGVMPGVLVGSNCLIGPGAQVLENIPDNTRVFTKFPKEVKPNTSSLDRGS